MNGQQQGDNRQDPEHEVFEALFDDPEHKDSLCPLIQVGHIVKKPGSGGKFDFWRWRKKTLRRWTKSKPCAINA
ncbi:MAG: hypothetical protein Kow0060_15040 [Methylohalobius crimeensis]